MGDESDSGPSLKHIAELDALRARALVAAQGVSPEDFLHAPESTVGVLAEMMARPLPGHSCPTCGRPMPMTGAQRQKRWRERNG